MELVLHDRAVRLQERRQRIREIDDVLELSTCEGTVSDKELVYLLRAYYLEIGVQLPSEQILQYNIDAYRMNEQINSYSLLCTDVNIPPMRKSKSSPLIQVNKSKYADPMRPNSRLFMPVHKKNTRIRNDAWTQLVLREERQSNQHKPPPNKQMRPPEPEKNTVRLNKILERAVSRNKVQPACEL
jgi:hypothetical protein